MISKSLFLLVCSLSAVAITSRVDAAPQIFVTTLASGGTTASQMATVIRDTGSQFTIVGTPTVSFTSTSGSATSDGRAVGTFGGGNVAAGTSLDDPVDPSAVFAGGIGAASGVCLSTGFLSDGEPSQPSGIPAALKVGVQGANNGFPIDLASQTGQPIPNHEGEASKTLQSTAFSDVDFRAVHATLPTDGGDPAVLQFNISLTTPGFLRVSFVFGSDEFPAWMEEDFNDTIVILVKGPCTPQGNPGENLAKFVRNGVSENFSFQALEDCDELFRENNMSPASIQVNTSTLHDIPGANYFDHEFGGFSKVLTRETARPLAPGTFTIKFVIEDISDRQVDSALFIPTGSLKLFALAPGDYDGNGCVDVGDYMVWEFFEGGPGDFFQGDGNGDCVVDEEDYDIWYENYGTGGNRNFAADFNRDGDVDGADLAIYLT